MNERSDQTRIEQPVDVLVTETLWNFGLGEGILGVVLDARERFLNDGARIVPEALESWLAPVEVPELYEGLDRWPQDYEVDMSVMRSLAMNNVHRANFERSSLVAEPEPFVRVDMRKFQDRDVEGSVEFIASRSGTVHGLAGWFAAKLSSNVRISTAPPNPAPNWGHAFFPLDEPVPVRKDDRLAASVRSTNNGEIWSWVVHEADGAPRPYAQSTLKGFPLSLEQMRKLSPQFRPNLSRLGEFERFVLDRLDGSHPISEIEHAALESFPDTLYSRRMAAAYVRSIVRRYGS
jgi:hypothetical protein